MPLTVTTSTASYPVLVEPGALEQLPALLDELGLRGTCWLVSDAAVDQLYGDRLAGRLTALGHPVQRYSVPPGDASKSQAQLAELHGWMIGGGVERRDVLLALGGGVVGDLGGFAAATVLRGIAVVQIPTTLLAMVDAAVGGKTGINHPLGKNLIGAFHQPRLVLADTDTLASLPARALCEGFAEVIKHGVISDVRLFTDLEQHSDTVGSWISTRDAGQQPLIGDLIRRAVAVKVGVVSRDEFEQGERIALNYGHTIGHAVEQLSAYGLLHGEAVAIGMHAEARLAAQLGLCEPAFVGRQQALLEAYELETAMPAHVDVEALMVLMLRDKKVQAKQIRWVLPTGVGGVTVRSDVPPELVRSVLI